MFPEVKCLPFSYSWYVHIFLGICVSLAYISLANYACFLFIMMDFQFCILVCTAYKKLNLVPQQQWSRHSNITVRYIWTYQCSFVFQSSIYIKNYADHEKIKSVDLVVAYGITKSFIVHIFHRGYFNNNRSAFQKVIDSSNGLNLADDEAQWIFHFWHGTIS